MKQHKTLFQLFLRHTAWKVLLILLLSAAVQVGLFLSLAPDPARYSLEIVLGNLENRLWWAALITFGLIVGLLLTASTNRGKGRTDYLLDRLAVPPREVLLCQGIYNTLALVLFWAAEALILLGLCWLYQYKGGFVGPQTVFLASWQNDLFHSFLPMEEVSRWVRNLSLFACMGFTTAAGSAQLRQKRTAIAVYLLIPALVASFQVSMGNLGLDVVYSLMALGLTAAALYNAFTQGKEDSHEEISSS